MKKFFSLAILVALIVSIAGCGSSSSDLYAVEVLYPTDAEAITNTAYYGKDIGDPPAELFKTTAAENGLEGNVYTVRGKVTDVSEIQTDDYEGSVVKIQTDNGDAVVMVHSTEWMKEQLAAEFAESFDWDKLSSHYRVPVEGMRVVIYAEYVGYSSVYDCASFYYGGSDYYSYALANALKATEQAPQTEPIIDSASEGSTAPTKSVDEIVSIIKMVLEKEFDYVDISADETGMTISVASNGMAELLVLTKASGFDENFEPWNETKDALINLYSSIADSLEAIGRGNMVLMLNLVNDQNYDNVLLSIYNGVVVYDILAS